MEMKLNESENPFLISNFTIDSDILRKRQKKKQKQKQKQKQKKKHFFVKKNFDKVKKKLFELKMLKLLKNQVYTLL